MCETRIWRQADFVLIAVHEKPVIIKHEVTINTMI